MERLGPLGAGEKTGPVSAGGKTGPGMCEKGDRAQEVRDGEILHNMVWGDPEGKQCRRTMDEADKPKGAGGETG